MFFYFLDLVCLRALNWDVPHSQTPSPNGRFDPPKNTPCLCFLSGTLSKVKPLGQDWLIAAGAYSGFSSMKRLRVFQLPLGGTLVHRMSLPRNLFHQQFAGTHLHSWVQRGTMRVACLASEHNTMSPARTARSGDKRTTQEATAPPRGFT